MTRLFIAIIDIRPTINTGKGNCISSNYNNTNRILKNIDNKTIEIHFNTENKNDIEQLREIISVNDELEIYSRRKRELCYSGRSRGCSIMEYVNRVGLSSSFVLNVDMPLGASSEELIETVKEEKGRSIYLV
tara:strand:- start:138 stop:533 length:396 start_codon:yes stop_codon:yes gene_type:complete